VAAWMSPRPHPPAATAGIRVARGHGARPQRIRVVDQEAYWRHTVAKLHASAVAAFKGTFIPLEPYTPKIAQTGPVGTGERWFVDLVHVNVGSLYGQAPLVVQQINAQKNGIITTPPPPVVAQIWHTIGGLNVTLLGQTSQGGADALAVAAELEQGHMLTVMWFGLATPNLASLQNTAWYTATGTKTVLTP
jgi:hypothetical protein